MKLTCTLIRTLLVGGTICALSLPTTCIAREYTEEFHKSYPLPKDGKISLNNVNGKVNITTWDKLEVEVDAVKKAKEEADLKEVEINVTSGKDSLDISTKYPSQSGWRKGNSTSVDYTLKVPPQAVLDSIETVNGNVEIAGVGGDVHASTVNGGLSVSGLVRDARLSTVNGTVKAAFQELAEVKNVKLNTVNGTLRLALPEGANARIKASTVNGSLHTDFGLKVKSSFPLGRSLDAQLGSDGPVVKLNTVNGTINIEKSAAK